MRAWISDCGELHIYREGLVEPIRQMCCFDWQQITPCSHECPHFGDVEYNTWQKSGKSSLKLCNGTVITGDIADGRIGKLIAE
jgi:hypothetical protein